MHLIFSLIPLLLVGQVVLSAKLQKRQSGGMTDDLRQSVVDQHNSYRSQLANGQVQGADGPLPTAMNMNQLSYSQDLESKAQDWANQCTWEHNSSGQNLYMASPEDPSDSIVNAAQMWWAEVSQYSSSDNQMTMDVFNEGVGHFTQMAWAQATQVGCGIQQCSDGSFLVCNYDTGNVIGENIFDAGTPCLECSEAGCTNDNLCVVQS